MRGDRRYRELIDSPRWRALRARKLAAQPLCEECLKRGLYRQAEEVHHLRPILSGHSQADRERLAFSPDNLESVCRECHLALHRKLRHPDDGTESEEVKRFVKRFL